MTYEGMASRECQLKMPADLKPLLLGKLEHLELTCTERLKTQCSLAFLFSSIVHPDINDDCSTAITGVRQDSRPADALPDVC